MKTCSAAAVLDVNAHYLGNRDIGRGTVKSINEVIKESRRIRGVVGYIDPDPGNHVRSDTVACALNIVNLISGNLFCPDGCR